jgi:AcrR family transcriptional regulator
VGETRQGSAPAGGGIRDRFRAHVRDEVKQVALRQLAEGGPQALSVNAIARELGVSGPALYRYFASRDELLTDLVVDAYQDFAVALEIATRRTRGLGPAERLRALADAYRSWATAEPHRYRLLFAAPVPGYDAQAEQLVTASKEAMNVLLDVLTDLVPDSDEASGGAAPTVLDRQLDQWAESREVAGVLPALALAAMITWSRLHGLVSLEIEGNYRSMGIDPALLLETEIAAILDTITA